MKKEWTEHDLRVFVRSAQAAFEDVTLTEADEESARSWQDDGLMVDYELRNGQVDCVLRRQIVADGKVWQLQMTAPLAGNDLPEDRMTPRERELCRDDMNHDFLSGVFNRRYFEIEFCTRLDDWTDAHRCASLALVELDKADLPTLEGLKPKPVELEVDLSGEIPSPAAQIAPEPIEAITERQEPRRRPWLDAAGYQTPIWRCPCLHE